MDSSIHIKGLKISGELCLIRLRSATPAMGLLSAFCTIMADSRINIPFISTAHQAGGLRAACCVEAIQETMIKRLMDAEPTMNAHVSYTAGVGLLTLFPHQSSLTLFGFSLRALFRQNIRVLGLASSIGALTYVLDYPKLELAADVLKSCFKLQENHSPFRAEFIVSQTARPRPAG